MVFPVVMYGCESWTVKKAEHRRIDAFELWCLENTFLLLFSHGGVSDPLWPHGWQHARPPCPSPTPRVYSNSRPLLFGRKVITNLDSILKRRDITLPTKVRLVKAMVFPVVMYGCESWTVKKAERQRIDAFELWCWRRLLESRLDCKEIQPVHSKGN